MNKKNFTDLLPEIELIKKETELKILDLISKNEILARCDIDVWIRDLHPKDLPETSFLMKSDDVSFLSYFRSRIYCHSKDL